MQSSQQAVLAGCSACRPLYHFFVFAALPGNFHPVHNKYDTYPDQDNDTANHKRDNAIMPKQLQPVRQLHDDTCGEKRNGDAHRGF
ncbi:MAG TPA: hypothetical protein VNG51_29970 [Ktedonobacteraceae bacterium]|nr:hypothetical protein [Ktedonobacteraceae bacterium]